MERLISRPIPHQLLHDPDAPYLVLPTLKGHILFTLASARPKQRSWQRRRDRQFQMFQDSADNADQWIGLRRKEDTSHLDFTSSFVESEHSEDASISDQPCERFPQSDNTCAPVPLCNRCIRTMGSPMNHQTDSSKCCRDHCLNFAQG